MGRGSHEDLQRYVLQFLDTRVEKLHQMGQASRQKAELEFAENIVLESYLQEIDTIQTFKAYKTRSLQKTV